MKKSILVLSLCLLVSTLNAQLWLVDPLEAIYPDSNKFSNYSKKWEADFPLGTEADVNVVIRIPVGESFSLSASINGIEINSNWNQLIDVPVEENTGLDSRTEQFTNQINPFVIRRAPFKIFEVIKPINNLNINAKTEFSAFRLTIPSSDLEEQGDYIVNISVNGESIKEEGIFTFTVYQTKLPMISESQFFYTNWFNLNQMEKKHELDRWTEEWFIMLDKYANLMAHGRQNSITIPSELIYLEEDSIILDESKMLRFINVFRKYGFRYFESPHLMYRGDNDDWDDPELKVALTKKRYYTENGKKDIEEMISQIKKFATSNNLTNNWLQHISDEPTEINAKCYKDVANHVKSVFPQIKIMEATNDRDNLVGAVDIWCPLINDFQENELFFKEREENGEQVLVYTCLIPGGKWLNRTLDMEKLRQVYFGWGAAFYNTRGYLHWGLNQFYANPYEQSVVKHHSPIAGPNNYLPAGDTHIIYPDINGPLSSLRFEAHRMGIEDYELLQKLKPQNLRLYKELISKLFRSYTDYSLDLVNYRKTRKELLISLY